MQDTEHDGSACEERHDEGHYHADEEALRAAFDVVGGIAADRTGNKYEQSRKDIPYHQPSKKIGISRPNRYFRSYMAW